ncbi:autophagy-related protein 9-like [Schistocerca gregaria]|uniref:autophagy-related protein 9-like n=1 Tax=Schistocerca gregaria TaxID=7010 RepID=UPI00211EB38F|nr:autophagy-related protein 9-like [Schistocerca gregaria]
METGSVDYHPLVEEDPYHFLKANPYVFLQNFYWYYEMKGFENIFMAYIFRFILAEFILSFTFTLGYCISWRDVINEKTNKLLTYPTKNVATAWCILSIILAIVLIMIGIRFLKTAFQFKNYCANVLHVHTRELASMPWGVFLTKLTRDKFSSIEKSQLTSLDFVKVLMRRENYLIALFNKKILNLSVPYFPKFQFVTHVFGWCFALSFDVFNDQGEVKGEYLDPQNHERLVAQLKSNFYRTGLIALIFSPIVLIVLILYGIFSLAERIQNTPDFLGSRNWTPHARWEFRDFDEVLCLFTQRLAKSFVPASKYINQFQIHALNNLGRLLVFLLALIAAPLILLTLVRRSIIDCYIGDRSVVWVLSILGTSLAILRSLLPEEHFVFEPHEFMEEVIMHIHHLPLEWVEKAHTPEVHKTFVSYFQFKVVIFLVEVLSVIITPLLFIYSLPLCAEETIQFLRDMTIEEPGLGRMVCFARLNMDDTYPPAQEHYISQPDRHKLVDTQKMQMSIINFKANYPNWEPTSASSKLFLDTIVASDPGKLENCHFTSNHSVWDKMNKSYISQSTKKFDKKVFYNVEYP